MFFILFVAACSWEQTKQVRNYIEYTLTPFLNKHDLRSFELSQQCPFRLAESKDALKPYEKYKQKKGVAMYECEVCKKQFRSEEYLESHILKNHFQKNRGICLGDFCEFLPCEDYLVIKRHRCEAVVQLCFKEDLVLEALELCNFEEESSWNFIRKLPLKTVMLVLCVVGCIVYYMVIWSEYENKPAKKVRVLKKTRVKCD